MKSYINTKIFTLNILDAQSLLKKKRKKEKEAQNDKK
jgi:hypothetical protein